jgi:uncharacterized membrane protein
MAGWAEYATALAAFVLAHVLPTRPRIRGRLTAIAGERGYLVLYSLVSLGLLYWLILAAARAPFVQLWPFAPWQLWVPNLVLPPVVLLVTCGVGIANPFSFGGKTGPEALGAFDPERPGITAVTRHPLLLGILLWAIAHLVPNGNLAHGLLFGIFALMAVLGMWVLDRRRRRQWGPERFATLGRHTALLGLPHGGLPHGSLRAWADAFPPRRIAIAVLVYLAIVALHPLLFGVSPSPLP